MFLMLCIALGCKDLRREAYLREREPLDNVTIAEELGGAPTWHPPEAPPEIRWALSRAGASLELAYEISNNSDRAIWIFDGPDGSGDGLQIRRGLSHEHAVLTLGIYLSNIVCDERSPPVYARRVEAGEIVDGVGRAELPLKASVKSAVLHHLAERPDDVRLEIGWTLDDDDFRSTLLVPDETAEILLVGPAQARQRWLVSEALPLPD